MILPPDRRVKDTASIHDGEHTISGEWVRFALAVFAVKGFNESFNALAISYYTKNQLGWSPAASTMWGVVYQLAWNLKPLLGFVSDQYRLCGYHRVSYITCGMVISAVCWLLMGLSRDTTYFVILMTTMNTCVCMAFTCGEAVVAEQSQGSSRQHSNKLQTWIWGSAMVGGLLGGVVGGQLEAFAGYQWVFYTSAVAPLVGLPFQFRPTIERLRTAEEQRTACEYLTELRWCFSQRSFWGSAIFIFVFFMTPGMGSSTFYYYSNHLHIHKETMSLFGIVGNLFGLVGMVIYYMFLSHVGARRFMFWGNLLVTLLTALQLILFTHANKDIGIPDVAFIFIDDAILSFAGQALSIPILSMVAMLCPPGMEGTVFCFFTALMNVGSTVSSALSGLLMNSFGITATVFDNIIPFRITTLCLQLIPCLLIWLLPTEEQLEAQCSKPSYKLLTNKECQKDEIATT